MQAKQVHGIYQLPASLSHFRHGRMAAAHPLELDHRLGRAAPSFLAQRLRRPPGLGAPVMGLLQAPGRHRISRVHRHRCARSGGGGALLLALPARPRPLGAPRGRTLGGAGAPLFARAPPPPPPPPPPAGGWGAALGAPRWPVFVAVAARAGAGAARGRLGGGPCGGAGWPTFGATATARRHRRRRSRGGWGGAVGASFGAARRTAAARGGRRQRCGAWGRWGRAGALLLALPARPRPLGAPRGRTFGGAGAPLFSRAPPPPPPPPPPSGGWGAALGAPRWPVFVAVAARAGAGAARGRLGGGPCGGAGWPTFGATATARRRHCRSRGGWRGAVRASFGVARPGAAARGAARVHTGGGGRGAFCVPPPPPPWRPLPVPSRGPLPPPHLGGSVGAPGGSVRTTFLRLEPRGCCSERCTGGVAR